MLHFTLSTSSPFRGEAIFFLQIFPKPHRKFLIAKLRQYRESKRDVTPVKLLV